MRRLRLPLQLKQLLVALLVLLALVLLLRMLLLRLLLSKRRVPVLGTAGEDCGCHGDEVGSRLLPRAFSGVAIPIVGIALLVVLDRPAGRNIFLGEFGAIPRCGARSAVFCGKKEGGEVSEKNGLASNQQKRCPRKKKARTVNIVVVIGSLDEARERVARSSSCICCSCAAWSATALRSRSISRSAAEGTASGGAAAAGALAATEATAGAGMGAGIGAGAGVGAGAGAGKFTGAGEGTGAAAAGLVAGAKPGAAGAGACSCCDAAFGV